MLEIDSSSDISVKTAAATLEKTYGATPPPLHGIVNNAGIAAGTINEVLNVNVRGPQRVDAAFLPLLDPKVGRIVQMSSGAASGCVSKSSDAKKAFFTNPDVTWTQIVGLMDEVEAYPAGTCMCTHACAPMHVHRCNHAPMHVHLHREHIRLLALRIAKLLA